MKALAFRLPQPVGAREDPCRANARRILRNLVGGDARDYGKALSRFQRQAARGRADGEALLILLKHTPDEASAAALLATAADAGVRADAAIWAALERKWRVAGDVPAAARARSYLVELDAPPPPPQTSERLARKRTLWLRRLAARSEHDQCAAAVSAFVASGAATPAMLRAVRRAADASKALDAALARDPCLEKAFEAAAAAPREPRSRRPVTAPPPSPDAPVSETPDSSVPSSPFGASPEPSPEPSPAPSEDEAASVPSDDDQSLATFMSGLGSLNGVVSLTGNRVGPWSAPSSRAGTARQSTRSRKSLGDDPE